MASLASPKVQTVSVGVPIVTIVAHKSNSCSQLVCSGPKHFCKPRALYAQKVTLLNPQKNTPSALPATRPLAPKPFMSASLPRPENEQYITGYSDSILKYQMSRTAEKQAGFVLPLIHEGFSVLDCGCGPGSISLGLAQKVGPKGKMVGIDIEEKVVAGAQTRAEEAGFGGVANFLQASIYALPFHDNAFDVVFAHAVIQHLSEPDQAVAEMVRVLKVGGVIALHAPDWGGFLYAPRTPGMVAAIEYYMALQIKKGADPYAGRQLKSRLQQVGVHNLEVQFSFETDPPAAAASFLEGKIEQSIAEGAIEKGWTTTVEVEQMLWALRNELGADPGAVWAPTRCEIVGRKAA